MTSSEIRQSFLDFFKEKQHTIVPSSSLLPDAPNLLFTNAGMNQFVPIFLGQAPCPYSPARAADTQKCIRAGGKHNDLEDVGFDTYHHTFFEMLGNWSFGNYFKKEAIEWAWELVVNRWGFPPSRVYATVYCPHMIMSRWDQEMDHVLKMKEEYVTALPVIEPSPKDAGHIEWSDHEAIFYWAKIFRAAGLDPKIHIVPGNKKDNFWMMGDTGPCGPCSELHIDLTPGTPELSLERQTEGRKLVNSGDARCIEIWNLVFIQFDARVTKYRDEGEGEFKMQVPCEWAYDPLPAKHVDTGMGFERVASMIQGTKNFTDFENAKISNYETDIFWPYFKALEAKTGLEYRSTLPTSIVNLTDNEKVDKAYRVIADHIRALSLSIADNIRPSNEGRGYVLRRILRRAVSYGREIGSFEPFLYSLVDVVAETMGDIFPNVRERKDMVKQVIFDEEKSFNRTLDAGMMLFNEAVDAVRKANSKTFPGDVAFKLHDTHGFPIDLTQLKARECDLAVDITDYERLMEEQKARGKAAQRKERIEVYTAGDTSTGVPVTDTSTVYEPKDTVTEALYIEKNFVITEKTPFYAEMGGQVGDTGTLSLIMADANVPEKVYTVENTVKSGAGGTILHKIREQIDFSAHTSVRLHVDEPRRAKIEGHHSGTHIMHWALRKVLGTTVSQKGSYVGPDRLRFDFSHGTAMTPDEIAEVEKLVNEKIAADLPVKWDERPYAQVKGDPSILQFFGDKYGETVRVVSIGDFSRELCGGTHVRNSAKIGYFKILHESAIAAGIRRIEAMSGDALRVHLEELLAKQEAIGAGLARIAADASTSSLWDLYKSREKQLHDLELQRIQNEKESAKKQEAEFQSRAATEAPDLIATAKEINGIPYIGKQVEAPAAYLPILADALKTRFQGVTVLATADTNKVALLAAVAPAHTKKIQAGKIIQAIAPLVGGKGGGRPELAQGGGTNPAGIADALAKAESLL